MKLDDAHKCSVLSRHTWKVIRIGEERNEREKEREEERG